MKTLPAREAYSRWAPSYSGETVVSSLDDRLVESLGTQTARRALLDVGCGTGRRLRDCGASIAVGVDLTPEMLAQSVERRAQSESAPLRSALDALRSVEALCAGDVRALPFASDSFDVVWCRLVIGHVRALRDAYAELARVCRVDGTVIVTDLCAEAVAAGHRRTFRDAAGALHEVEHFVHTDAAHADAAVHAGLALVDCRVGAIDDRVRPFYVSAGKLAAYEAQRGLPLVLALSLRKEPPR